MKEVQLVKSSVYLDELPKISHVDQKYLEEYILYISKKNKKNINEFELPIDKHITWVMDYIRDKFVLTQNKSLSIVNILGKVYNKKTTFIKKNYFNLKNTSICPEYTFIYVINSNDEIVIEFKTNFKKNLIWKKQIKNREYILWNSHLNYYINFNKKYKNKSIFLLINCKVI